jgi:hypothetical protein
MHTDQPPRPGRVAQSDHLLTRSRQIPARDGQRPSAQHTKLSAPDSQTAASLASCVNVLFKVVGFSRRAGLQRRARCSHSPDIAIRRLCGRSAAGLTACAVRLTFQGGRILNGATSGLLCVCLDRWRRSGSPAITTLRSTPWLARSARHRVVTTGDRRAWRLGC